MYTSHYISDYKCNQNLEQLQVWVYLQKQEVKSVAPIAAFLSFFF